MAEKLYHECVFCHSSGESKDGKGVCPECKGSGRYEVRNFEDLAVDLYRDQLSND